MEVGGGGGVLRTFVGGRNMCELGKERRRRGEGVDGGGHRW